MLYFILKAAISGVIVALVSTVAKKPTTAAASPGAAVTSAAV